MTDFRTAYLAAKTGEQRKVALYLDYVDINDGYLHDAVLFSQIMYWHLPTKKHKTSKLRVKHEGEYWIAKKHDEWYDECRVKAPMVRKALKRIEDRSLIHYTVTGFSGKKTPLIRINWEGFQAAITPQYDTLYQTNMIHCIESNTDTTRTETTKEKDLPEINSGSGTGDDGDDEWLHATWDTKNNTEHIFCTDGCNGMIDKTYYYDGKGRVLCPGCYVARNDTNPPTPPKPAHVICPECKEPFVPNDDGICKYCGLHREKSETPHERYQALEARKNAPQLTAEQAEVLEHIDNPEIHEPMNHSDLDLLLVDGLAEAITEELGEGTFSIEYAITDTGRAALEDYRKCCESQQSKDCAGTEHINPAALCEVVEDGMPHVDNCVVCQGDMFDIRTITYYTGYDNWPFPVCESCETWLQSLEREAPKPAPQKGRAKAICSKCGKKARKVIEGGMCWECNGYPDRAKMIDVIYATWERKPQPTTMYSAANIKLMTTVAQWGTTLETLPDYVRWMISHYDSKDWTLKIGSFGKEDMWHEWQGSTAHELPMHDDPLYSDWIPAIYSEPTPKLTKAEGEALEAKVFKQMTELPTLPPEEGDDE